MEMKTDGLLRNVPLKELSLSEELCESLSKIGINDLEDLSMLKEEDIYLLPFMNDGYIHELKNVIPSSFHDSPRIDEEVLREIPLSLLHLSNHALNVLHTYDIRFAYDLIEKENLFLQPVSGLGLKSLTEIKNMIQRLKEDRRFPDLFMRFLSSGCILPEDGNIRVKNSSLYVKDVSLNSIFSDLSLQNFLQKLGFMNLSGLLLSMEGLSSLSGVGVTKCHRIKNGIEDYILKNIHVMQSVEKQSYLKKREDILLLLKKDPSKGVFKEELYENKDKEDVDAILESLLREGKVDITMEGRILYHFPSFALILKRHSMERSLSILKEKLQGKTLEEIAKKEGVTRERIRQRIERFMNEHAKDSLFLEDRFQYLFTTYFTDEKSFTDITGCESFVYFYLVLRYQKGEKSLEEAFYDENVLLEIRERIFSYGYANLIRVEGELIRKSRSTLFDFYISHHLSVTKRLEDIIKEYNSLALKYGEDFTYPNTHSLENKLVFHPFSIFSGHHRFRYYDYSSYDYQELLDDIRLESYHDTFFSTEYFYRRNPSLMKEYDIRDKNELFSVLKRLYSENHDIHFVDMPYIIIGNFNRKEYLLGILKEYGELSTKDFAKILDERLGISNQGPFWLADIREYMMKRGVFFYDVGKEDYSALTEMLEGKLTEDFYFKKELSNIIPGVDIENIPNVVYDRFGYLSYSSYILKSSYDAKSYFNYILSKDDFISEDVIDRYKSVTMFSEVFYSLRKNHDIIQCKEDRFLSFSFLEKKGFRKEDIQEYTDKVYESMDDSFFTMKNVKEKNIQSRLDNLELGDIFYEDLLKNDERFAYCIIHHQTIFIKGNVPFTRKTFLFSVLSSFDSVDYPELDSHLQNRYGLHIPKSRIDEYILSTDIYFDKISQKYYKDYETYLSEMEKGKEESVLLPLF